MRLARLDLRFIIPRRRHRRPGVIAPLSQPVDRRRHRQRKRDVGAQTRHLRHHPPRLAGAPQPHAARIEAPVPPDPVDDIDGFPRAIRHGLMQPVAAGAANARLIEG